MARQRGLYILDPNSFELIYGPDEQRDIAAMVEIVAPPLSAREALGRPELLAQADVIFSGWSGPVLDERFLDAAPRLKAVFYGAGSMGYILTPAVWERGIVVTTALEANAVPVAEYALATILFSLKHGWKLARRRGRAAAIPIGITFRAVTGAPLGSSRWGRLPGNCWSCFGHSI